MADWKVPLYRVYWDQDDIDAVSMVVRRGAYWVTGPEIEEFERQLAAYTGTKFAVSFNSGTSALHALMLAAGIHSGDEVITPSFTFIATSNAPLFVGARPIFCDIEGQTFGMEANSLESAITERTKAIIPVHYGGLSCKEILAIRRISQSAGIPLYEDAAESIGSYSGQIRVGSFGSAAVLSFCGNKVISCGEGGAVVTGDGELFEKLKLVRSHGRLEKEPYFLTSKSLDYIQLGYNWRMSSITASLGLSQLKKLDKVIAMRREVAKQFSEELSKIPGLVVPTEPPESRHVFQMYTIRVSAGKPRREALREFLTKKRIMCKVYFDPVHLSTFYRELYPSKAWNLPKTIEASREVLTLPIFPSMSSDDIKFVTSSVKEFFQEH